MAHADEVGGASCEKLVDSSFNNPALAKIQVKLDRHVDRQKPCCQNWAVLAAGKGPHAAELKCMTCGAHRGWVSKTTFNFIETTVRLFGVTEPFVIKDTITNEVNEMASVSEMFPSPYIRAGDLGGKPV